MEISDLPTMFPDGCKITIVPEDSVLEDPDNVTLFSFRPEMLETGILFRSDPKSLLLNPAEINQRDSDSVIIREHGSADWYLVDGDLSEEARSWLKELQEGS